MLAFRIRVDSPPSSLPLAIVILANGHGDWKGQEVGTAAARRCVGVWTVAVACVEMNYDILSDCVQAMYDLVFTSYPFFSREAPVPCGSLPSSPISDNATLEIAARGPKQTFTVGVKVIPSK